MQQQSIFDNRGFSNPLASRMRPQTLADYVGQQHLLGNGKILRQLIDQDQVSSMIFWGPPGVGKTTLARIIAGKTKADFVDFSAVTSGIKEIKEKAVFGHKKASEQIVPRYWQRYNNLSSHGSICFANLHLKDLTERCYGFNCIINP